MAVHLADRVHALLDDLPDAQRQVVVLRDIEGLPPSEVGALLGITDGNQRVLLHRARARLRELLAREVVAS
jgi:RNA polymerase sigma-70 factor (ECF subfamily)